MTYSLVLLMLLSLGVLLYFTYKPYKNFRGIFKIITSLLFISIAVSGYVESNNNFNYFIFIFISLVFSLLGDVFLIFEKGDTSSMSKAFVYGLLSFSIAHIFFSIGFIYLSYFSIYNILFTLLLSILLLVVLKSIKSFDFKGAFFYVAFYSIVISFMFIQSLTLYYYISSSNPCTILITIGALLFVLSDLILAFDYFHINCPKFMPVINLLVYYIAQLLLALSVLYI
ncbi:MAG: lysoplasmalogenase [Romboutsia sp.]